LNRFASLDANPNALEVMRDGRPLGICVHQDDEDGPLAILGRADADAHDTVERQDAFLVAGLNRLQSLDLGAKPTACRVLGAARFHIAAGAVVVSPVGAGLAD
jgi:hypothetical protein